MTDALDKAREAYRDGHRVLAEHFSGSVIDALVAVMRYEVLAHLDTREAAREQAERERDELDAVWHNAESKIAELELRAGKAEAELSRLRKAAKEARDDAARACEVGGGNPILALAGIKSRLTSALEPEGGDPDKPETRVSGPYPGRISPSRCRP